MTTTNCYLPHFPVPGFPHPHHCSCLTSAGCLEHIPWFLYIRPFWYIPKPLSCMQSQFIQPYCTSDIKLWVTICSHCFTVFSSSYVSCEICFLWPITGLFSILHANLWSTGVATSTDGYTHVLGVKCNINGFVLLAPLKTILSNNLTISIMERDLLQIGFCHDVHIDACFKLKSVFEAMCNSLSHRFSTAAKGRYQFVSEILTFNDTNNAVNIANQDWTTLSVWVPTISLAVYIYSSCPISSTVIQGIPAVGDYFGFLLISIIPTQISSLSFTKHHQSCNIYLVSPITRPSPMTY